MMPKGEGCTCNAQGEFECACDADWTPQELIDARALIASLKRCGTCRWGRVWDMGGMTCENDDSGVVRVTLRDTCDKWEIDSNETD